jgi:hypothetical protein
VLTCTGFSNDAGFTHPSCQKRLTYRMVNFVRTGMIKVFTFEIDLRATQETRPSFVRRQALNVYRMKLLGAEVVPVEGGTKTLKDAINEAMRDWVANIDNTFYLLGTVVGPPGPTPG